MKKINWLNRLKQVENIKDLALSHIFCVNGKKKVNFLFVDTGVRCEVLFRDPNY